MEKLQNSYKDELQLIIKLDKPLPPERNVLVNNLQSLMPLQYIQDFNGATTAVIIPIEEWNKITEKYSDLEVLPQWQQNIIDQRLDLYQKNPGGVMPIDQFFERMDKGKDEL